MIEESSRTGPGNVCVMEGAGWPWGGARPLRGFLMNLTGSFPCGHHSPRDRLDELL